MIQPDKGKAPACAAIALTAALLLTFKATLGPGLLWGGALWAGFCGVTAYRILRSGKVSFWRPLYFSVLAACFILYFKLLHPQIDGGDIASATQPPACHIALASSALNYANAMLIALSKSTAGTWGPLIAGVLWLLATLALGQAWCSWACFYGGIDDGLSRVLPRKWQILRFYAPSKIRHIQSALLLAFLLAGLGTMTPAFCHWVCPLKMTCFSDALAPGGRIQMIVVWALGLSALALGPLLTGRRTFCGLLCPFGAWQAFFGRLNPFRVTATNAPCGACSACKQACPVFAITKNAEAKTEISAYCNRCGNCIDACPNGRLRYTLLGKELPAGSWLSVKTLFVCLCLYIGGLMGSLYIPALLRELCLRLIS